MPSYAHAALARALRFRILGAAATVSLVLAQPAVADEPASEAAGPPPNIARIVLPTTARAEPGGGRPVMRLSPLAPLGNGPAQYRILTMRERDGRRYAKVLLPKRPNGTSGWIPTDAAQLSRTEYEVVIDRASRRARVRFEGRTIKRFSVVVGHPSSPTPRGHFAVSEILRQVPDSGFLGRWLMPITAFSGTYKQFDGGPGRIGMHGRAGASLRDPLGTAVSHGCIRIDNRVMSWLVRRLEPGVPVTIR